MKSPDAGSKPHESYAAAGLVQSAAQLMAHNVKALLAAVSQAGPFSPQSGQVPTNASPPSAVAQVGKHVLSPSLSW